MKLISKKCNQWQIRFIENCRYIGSVPWLISSYVYLPGARSVTPLKTNMSSENQWLEDVFPTKIVPFLGTC